MIDLLLSWLTLALVVLVLLLLPRQFRHRPRRIGIRLEKQGDSRAQSLSVRLWATIVSQVGERYAPTVTAGERGSPLERLLVRAALELTPAQFLTIRVAAALGGCVLGLAAGIGSGSITSILLFTSALSVIGYFAPVLYARGRARLRARRALEELPGWLYTYAMILSAAATPEVALGMLSDAADGVLYREGRRASREVRENVKLRDALQGMASRIGSEEVTQTLQEIATVAEAKARFREVLYAEAATTQSFLEMETRKRLGENQMIAMGVTVIFAMPLLMTVVVGPYFLRMLTSMSGGGF